MNVSMCRFFLVRAARPAFAGVAAFLAFTSVAAAKQTAPIPASLDSRIELPTAIFPDRRLELDTGISRAVYAPNFTARAAEPEAMAREYLEARREELGLDASALADLVHHTTRRGLAATTVRFHQIVGGVLVDGDDVAVSFDAAGRVLFVMNGYRPNVRGLSTTPAVSSAAARGDAIARLGVDEAEGFSFEETKLVFAPDGASARLAWRVKVVPRVEPHGDWEVLVDARTGEIFRVANEACHADGTGNVFDADPLSSAHVSYGATGYTDGNDANTTQLTGQLQSVTLQDITLNAGTYTLIGPYATIVDTESPFRGLYGQPSSVFAFNRNQDAFEAVNCYFHIDHVMRHINEDLGIALMPDQYSGGPRFDPHGLSGADNSHYISSTGVVSFGEGGVDDAEDSDVVIHELGHGIHDWAAGSISQVEGLSEGIGDYFAQSYSRSLGQWASNEAPYHWTFNWDGHNPFWGGRITNYGAVYPGGLVGQVHSDGQIWATCLMRIWNQVGRNKTDAAHIEGLAMTSGGSSQNDAANAVAQAAAALGYTPSEVAAFLNEFATTGYTVAAGLELVGVGGDDVCASVGPARPAGGDLRAQGDGLWEPGEEILLDVELESSLLTRTNVTGTIATTTPGVTILDGSATWPTLLPGVPTANDIFGFSIKIDDTVECYSTVDLEVTVTCAESGPHVFPITRSVGESLTPPGLPITIPNNNATGVVSTLSVGQDVTLTDLNVRVQINHNWVGDVIVRLQSPAGTTVTLLDRPGFPPANGCNNDNMDVTFDSASGFNLETHCPGTNPWYAGVAAPTQSLNAFNGQNTAGEWKLTVIDPVSGGNGTIVDWELLSTPALVSACEECTITDAPIAAAGGAAAFSLEPSRPNPFSGRTEIRFALGAAGPASLRVYDVAGRHVATLADGPMKAGAHAATWDGTDLAGRAVAGGMYFYRLTSVEGTKIERMQLVR